MSAQEKLYRVGSRNSQLALIQTNRVIDWLKTAHPHAKFEIISMTTIGDRILETALAKIGEKNLFTKELEDALADGRVDFLVHSLKDLPTALPPGMVIGAVCSRDDARDAVVMHKKHTYKRLDELPPNSVVGTSSLRRGAQLKRKYPQLLVENIRGNLNTRLRKLDEGDTYDCIILAAAGLERMGWEDRCSTTLEPEEGCLYAVCQGAMAVECRAGDTEVQTLLGAVHDLDSTLACVTERSFLATLEGGCSVPIGVSTHLADNKLQMEGSVFSIDGSQCINRSVSCSLPTTSGDQAHSEELFTGVIAGRHPVDAVRCASSHSEELFTGVIAGRHPVDAVRCASELGARLARELKDAGAEEIVRTAKQTIADEIRASHAAKAAARNGTVNGPLVTEVCVNGQS